jgi:hypothetical protein
MDDLLKGGAQETAHAAKVLPLRPGGKGKGRPRARGPVQAVPQGAGPVSLPGFECYHCKARTPKELWGPGRVTCPACGRRAPTAEEWHRLEDLRRLAEVGRSDLFQAVTCRVCLKAVGLGWSVAHRACALRMAAYRRALETWKSGATVGYGCLLQNGSVPVFYVGRVERALFKELGVGNSWGEAFARVRRVLFHLPREKVVYEE